MRPRLRRVAGVAAAVTAVDLGTLTLARRSRLGVVPADALAVTIASAVSWPLHRRFTVGGDPAIRWVGQPSAYLATAAATSAVDVALTGLLARRLPLAAAKGTGLATAAVARLVAYRAILLTDVRRDLQRSDPRPLPWGEHRLSVVVPAHDAAPFIGDTVRRLRADLAGVDAEVLVVVDGPDPAAADAARRAGARVVVHDRNRGKGAAVRTGMLAASGQVVAFTDADLAYPPRQLLDLLAAVEDGWDVAVGNRWHPGSTAGGAAPLLRRLSSRAFNLASAVVLLGRYRDTQCGLKAFRGDVARQIFSRTRLDGFAFDVEVLHLVERFRLSMVELPVHVEQEAGSTVRVGRAAPGMLADVLRVRRWAGRGLYDGPPRHVAEGVRGVREVARDVG